jgi:hypothetical protein
MVTAWMDALQIVEQTAMSNAFLDHPALFPTVSDAWQLGQAKNTRRMESVSIAPSEPLHQDLVLLEDDE